MSEPSPEMLDYFYRLGQQVALQDVKLARQVMMESNPMGRWVSEVNSKYVTDSNNNLSFSIQWEDIYEIEHHFRSTAMLLFCCENFPEQAIPHAANMKDWLGRENGPDSQFKQKIDDVMKCYVEIAQNSNLNSAFRNIKETVTQIEFIMIGVMLYALSSRDADIKALRIYDMRKDVRRKHAKISLDHKVMTTMWNFVQKASSSTEV